MTIGFGMGSPMQGKQDGLRLYTAKFVGAGTSTPTGLEGDASSVARDDTGDYTVTFPGDVTWDIRGVHCLIKQAATKDLVWQATYSETARTVTLTVKNAASSFAEIDLTTSEEVLLEVLVKTTKAPA